MSEATDANVSSTSESRDDIDYQQILAIDSLLDVHLDTNRRKSVTELTQGAVDLIQAHTTAKAVWIQFAGPRTFDGQPRTQTLLFSTGTEASIQHEVEALAEAYRLGNLESNRSLAEWEPMDIRSGEQIVIAAPMFEVSPEVYIGIFGMVLNGDSSRMQIRMAKQVASRLDTLINLKNVSSEHHTVIARANELLDQDGVQGLDETLLLLQQLVRASKAVIVYLNEPYDADVPVHDRRVSALFAENEKLVGANEKNLMIYEELGGNLVEYDGDLTDSIKALTALGIIDHPGGEPRPFVCLPLENRTRQPHVNIGKLLLIGSPPIDETDRDVMQSIAMQLDTKIVHYHRTKQNLRRSLSNDQVEFFVRRPLIADWFFENPRYEEIGMVFADLCGYTEITRQIGDPAETIHVAKEWIVKQIELTAKHGGYFDKDVGDCVVSLFGPPFYELSIESLLNARDTESLEKLMSDIPPDPEEYAYQAVMYALETLEAVKDYKMGDRHLSVAVGIEVGPVAIGDLNGRLGALTAMGDAMNLAARLQRLANSNEVVIGPNCRQRLEGYRRNTLASHLPFTIEPGGEARLKGYDKPIQYFLVKQRSA